MAFKFTKREVKSEKLLLKIELELIDSLYTADESASRLQYLIDSYQSKEFSSFIMFLMRETQSNSWEMKKLEIT